MFILQKVFVLGQFKMTADRTEYSRCEERLVAMKSKPCEIYRRICDMYKEVWFIKKSSQMAKTWV